MDVGADREVLRRHRAPSAADRHARRDRREVGAQHAGVDELAGQQPLEVVVAGRGDAAVGDRDDVGGRAADVDQQRVGVRVAPRRAPSPPSWRRRRPTGAPAPRRRTRARRPSSARSAAGRRARPGPRRGRTSTPSRLVRNASESSAVMVIATAPAGPPATSAATSRSTAASASRSRQTSNGREHRAQRLPRRSHAALVFAPPMSTASVAAAVAARMRVVGVIDLKGATAVHAVRGERERYRPVRSVIAGDDGDAAGPRARVPRRARARRAVRRRPRRDRRRRRAQRDASARWRARRASWSTPASASPRGRRRCWTSARTASSSGPRR